MAWIKACHIIAMVAWFAGLFYLPRLFVYHAQAKDAISLTRFNTMEHRLYYVIMAPAAVMTVIFGIFLLSHSPAYYLQARWMQGKLLCVLLLVIFHLYCGRLRNNLKTNKNQHSALFYRCFNEFPTLMLVVIILLAEIKPS